MATGATKRDRDGVLATCMNGQVTLQTFSSHSFNYDVMSPLWENMITNALKVRLLGSQ
jgi:uridylate kinase